ncbi:trehalase family glycosidase, partial [Salmonella enterica]|uniref:trehalase family glycosidase n=1 Tax=Salmonella enterica TaxID=28901 RepID=UPI000A508CF7
GWDVSSRWMDNPQQRSTMRPTTIAPDDLNALLYQLEKALARARAAAGDRAKGSHYDAVADARQKGLERHLWNNKGGWYSDYDLKHNKIRDQLPAAALFP